VLIGEALARYESQRGWEKSHARLQSLKQAVIKSRETRKRNYIAKTLRDCTRFLCRHTFKRFEVIDRSAASRELADLIEDPDKFIESGAILKNGNSSTVALVKLTDRSVVVKRYNIKNYRHGSRRAFRKSRAWLSWANAHRMEFLGIPALKPIALIETRLGPIRTTAYLITEFIEGPDALSCLTGTENPVGQLESLVDILQKLSEVRVSHGDLKATNFVMSEQGAVLIDLDSMKEHRSQQDFKQAFNRDLQRFLKNWDEYPLLNAQFSELLRDLCARYNVKR
jgi:tRNA A-37 threonylcarbamoyl transferase component Bud32